MFERWRSRRPRAVAETTEAVRAPGDAWRSLPPVQRVLDAPRPVAEPGFAASLATHWNPSFQTGLGHGALPDAPTGLLLDALRPAPAPNTELPGRRLPVTGVGAGAGAGAVPGVARRTATGAAVRAEGPQAAPRAAT
ncbi:hypothetical protein ABTY23_31975, partial [Streptomyces sp. NPDC096068]